MRRGERHWVAIYAKSPELLYYFDALADTPWGRIANYLREMDCPVKSNRYRWRVHESPDYSAYYCIAFIHMCSAIEYRRIIEEGDAYSAFLDRLHRCRSNSDSYVKKFFNHLCTLLNEERKYEQPIRK